MDEDQRSKLVGTKAKRQPKNKFGYSRPAEIRTAAALRTNVSVILDILG
jgi:hypothetical protein